jgi:transposase-like protein
MNRETEHQYIKKTQKDYSMAFKLGVVHEVESGELGVRAATRKYGIQDHRTVKTWLEKYGSFDWENKPLSKPSKIKTNSSWNRKQESVSWKSKMPVWSTS